MKKVFIASRFTQFIKIRKKLTEEMLNIGMEPIDLNDNIAVAHPPIERSLSQVRKSDIMILLVGDSYGTIPLGKSKSYTHLEYEEALKNNKPIYVFGIGQLYCNNKINYARSENMKEWQKQLENNQVISKFGDNEKIDIIVHEIITNIYKEENKIWYDEETGLMWQVQVPDRRYEWKDIFTYNENLNKSIYGGFKNWRIPTINELKTLRTEKSYPNKYGYDKETFIKRPLQYSMTMEHGRFWSRTSNEKDNNLAYGMHFNRIRSNSQSINGKKEKYKTRYIRCVRCWLHTEIEKEWNGINISPEIKVIKYFLEKYPDSKKFNEKAKKKLQELYEKKEDNFNNLSPFEQKLFAIYKNNKNIPKSTCLFKGIKNGEFDSVKYEALIKLKKLMQKENKWKDASSAKKLTKDRNYQRTLEIIELLNTCA